MEFVYIRATIGVSGIDDHFRIYADGALEAGLEVGFYHLFKPDLNGYAQSDFFLKQIESYQHSAALVPAIDFEITKSSSVPVTPGMVADQLFKLADGIETQTGKKPVMYTAKGYWSYDQIGKAHDSYFALCPLWVAHYEVEAPALPRCWTDWQIWQYTSEGHVDGISTRVDMDQRKL